MVRGAYRRRRRITVLRFLREDCFGFWATRLRMGGSPTPAPLLCRDESNHVDGDLSRNRLAANDALRPPYCLVARVPRFALHGVPPPLFPASRYAFLTRASGNVSGARMWRYRPLRLGR